MKVCHAIYSMGGGGAERQLCYLVAESERLGVSNKVFVVKDGPNTKRLRRSGAKIVYVGSRFGRVGVLRNIRNELRRERPQLVQTWLANMDVICGLAAISCGVPFIFGERSNGVASVDVRWRRLHRVVVNQSAGVVANSEVGRLHWAQVLPASKHCSSIPNGVPLAEIEHANPNIGRATLLSDHRRWVLHAGRLVESSKNIQFLCNVLKELSQQDRDVGIVLVGDGPDSAPVRELSKVLQGRMITFPYLHEYELWAMMKRSNVVVSCSRYEGTPNVLMEAMACRVPLVLSDIAQHRALLGDRGATYVGLSDKLSFVEAIRRNLSGTPYSRDAVESAYGRVALMSTKKMAKAYLDVFREITKS